MERLGDFRLFGVLGGGKVFRGIKGGNMVESDFVGFCNLGFRSGGFWRGFG